MAGTYEAIPSNGSPYWQDAVPTAADLPVGQFVGEAITTQDSLIIYIWDGATWNAINTGATAVTSVNGASGVVTLTTDDIAQGATNLYSTFANINTALAMPPNSFMASNASSEAVAYPNWGIDEVTNFSNVAIPYAPDNLLQNPVIHNWTVNVAPLQNSPNDALQLHTLNVNLDSAATGFSFGSAGDAAQLLNGGYNYGGNGATIGRLRNINMYSGLGNGTDPGTFGGFSGASFSLNASANITLDGSCNGFDVNLNLNASTITTSNFSVIALSDFSQMPVDVYGYQGIVIQPVIGTIKNNHNFTSFSSFPNIGTMEGNAGYAGLQIGPTITTLGTGGFNGVFLNPVIGTQQSNSGISGLYLGGAITTMGATGASYQGLNINPQIVTGHGQVTAIQLNPTIDAGDASVTLFNGSMSQVNTTAGPGQAFVLQLGGLHEDGVTQSEFSADGIRTNLSGRLDAASGLGFQGQHTIFTEYHTPAGVAITGTDVIMNILSPDIDMGSLTSSVALGPTGLGVNMVGFAGQIHGHGQMDQLSAVLPSGIFMDDFTLGEWRNVNATVINGGYTGVTTNATAFYHEVAGAGLFATNHWGLRVVTEMDNYVTQLALNTTSQKVTNSSVAIELGGVLRALVHLNVTTTEKLALTALPGMQVFDTTLAALSYYNGTAWV